MSDIYKFVWGDEEIRVDKWGILGNLKLWSIIKKLWRAEGARGGELIF